jgi:aminopeptidase N
MSSWAIDEATQFKPAWQAFYGGSKRSAYREDQLVTTHPIQTEVSDTSKAFASFDRITYGKGASVLRQLKFLLGTKDFTQGIRNYIKTHAYQNATIGDFIGALAKASGRDLTQWRKDWLETASLDRIQAEWTCDKGEVTSFDLKQEGSDENPLLRLHKTQVALYYTTPDGTLSAKEVLPVTYSQAKTKVDGALGKSCPVAVYPNHEDYDYVKVVLDPVSLTAMEHGLAKIDSSFARHMIWGSLFEMMVDARLSAQEFAALVYTQAASEKDSQVLVAALSGLVQSDLLQNSAMKFLSESLRAGYFPRTEEFTRQGLASSEPGSDLQLIWYRSFLQSVQPGSKGAADVLAWLKSGNGAPTGLKLDQDRRWEMIRTLARIGAPDAQALIQAEVTADPSDDGRKQSIGARAVLPDEGERDKWLSRIFREPSTSPDTHYRFAELRDAMRGIYAINQESLIQKGADRYFTNLPRLVKNSDAQDEEYIAALSGAMFPPLCEQTTVRSATTLLGSDASSSALVVKNVKIRRQDVERCIQARELSASRPAS